MSNPLPVLCTIDDGRNPQQKPEGHVGPCSAKPCGTTTYHFFCPCERQCTRIDDSVCILHIDGRTWHPPRFPSLARVPKHRNVCAGPFPHSPFSPDKWVTARDHFHIPPSQLPPPPNPLPGTMFCSAVGNIVPGRGFGGGGCSEADMWKCIYHL
jgi:hypothetical protein